MHPIRTLASLALTAILTACAAIGAPPIDTFNKRAAAADTLVQTVADSASAAFTAHKLSEADRQNVVTTGRAALQGIDMAKSLFAAACPTSTGTAAAAAACSAPAADAKLTATLAILQALQTYLATKGN